MNDWEFFLSASWATWEQFDPVEYIVDKIYRACPPEERLMFSGVSIIPTDLPELDEILEDVDIEHGLVKIPCGHYFQQDFERAYVFTAKCRSPEHSENAAYTP